MPNTTTPSEHLSIGEVLATLRDEYPDITISKIRFLESQGLIDPERTPSGYRKFYAPDVARLRWILHQQKENFLPLKVIKGRLESAAPGELPADVALDADPAAADPEEAAAPTSAKRASRSKATPEPAGEPPSRAAKTPAAKTPAAKTPAAKTPKARRTKRVMPVDMPVLPLDDGAGEQLDEVGEGHLTRSELATVAGLTDAQISELEDYGLLEPAPSSGDRVLFDDDALAVARLAAGFARHGIEARHLRMYRSFAEREATLFGQVIQGVLRQRNPEARARARDDLGDLAGLGRGMRTAFLRRAVDDLLHD